MKRVLTLAICINFLSFGLFSQVEIGKAEMPTVSSNILYSFGKTNSQIDHTIKGKGLSWDYTSLEYELQLKEEYKSAGSINFFFFGIKDGFGTKTADSLGAGPLMMRDIYDVFKTTSKKMTAQGRSLKFNGIPVPQFYSDEDEIYQFPLKYGRKDVSSFKVALTLGAQFSLIQSGTRTNTVEGEGSLKTPFKNYPSVIKVLTTIDQIDSIKIGPLPFFPIPRKMVEYKWLAAGFVGPVLIVKGISFAGRFTVQEIKFQDKPVSLVGFDADKYVASANSIIKLSDTSSISAQARTWIISPNTFTYMNGTNDGSKNPEIKFTSRGAYSVELLVRNRFGQMGEKRRNYIQITEAVSISELSDNDKFMVYPNPVSDILYFNTNTGATVMGVLNLSGQELEMPIKDNELNVSKLALGFYLLKVENESIISFVKFEKKL